MNKLSIVRDGATAVRCARSPIADSARHPRVLRTRGSPGSDEVARITWGTDALVSRRPALRLIKPEASPSRDREGEPARRHLHRQEIYQTRPAVPRSDPGRQC